MTITLTEAQHRLQSIVLHQPNVIRGGDNVSCSYFNPDGTAQCLVGEAFAVELHEAGIMHDSYGNETSFSDLVAEGFVEAEEFAVIYLDAAQAQQDLGATWGNSVAYAESLLAERLADQQLIAA